MWLELLQPRSAKMHHSLAAGLLHKNALSRGEGISFLFLTECFLEVTIIGNTRPITIVGTFSQSLSCSGANLKSGRHVIEFFLYREILLYVFSA